MMYSKCRKCGTLVEYKIGYCQVCKVIKDKEDRAKYRQYDNNNELRKLRHSTEWRKIRIKVLETTKGLCIICYLKGIYKPADHVHHIEPAHKDKSLFFDINNLIPVCECCHRYIHENKIESKDKLRSFVSKIRDKK